jgi:outer membrane protein OmpA-like peptidoglycan-associated protein
MTRLNGFLIAAAVMALLILPVSPLQGADTDGKVSLGLHAGLYKLGLTDRSDLWTPGWLANADLKYGITPKFALGVEGSWMQTYLADLSEGSKAHDGARLSFSKVADGPRQRAYVAGLFAKYSFLADRGWSPYVVAGSGIYIWKWIDGDGQTLTSDSAFANVDARMPKSDKAGNPYELKDQELYAMGGLGLEFFASDAVSFELGAKFRYLTHLLTSFTDDQDIVGTDEGELDLPKAIAEVYAGLTFYFGGQKYPPPTATASANPTSGAPPLTVQFAGSASGGRPPVAYSWNFGDGGSSDVQSPSHTYEAVGDYTALLTVTDSKKTTSQKSVSVTVSCPTLACSASGTPATGAAPLTVQFAGSYSGGCPPVAYSWSFGDGGTSTDQNPKHTYETLGNYTASLTVTDSKKTTSQKSVSISAVDEFVPTPEKPVILQGVNFATNKAILIETSMQILDRVATSLVANPDVKVEVAGHTDSDGTDEYNLKLSDRRAKAVRDYLIRKGVPAAQLTSKGYGESQPIADNTTVEGKAKNRRVELKRM